MLQLFNHAVSLPVVRVDVNEPAWFGKIALSALICSIVLLPLVTGWEVGAMPGSCVPRLARHTWLAAWIDVCGSCVAAGGARQEQGRWDVQVLLHRRCVQ